MPTPQPATTTRKTPNFDFLFGAYSYSNCAIPYFQVSMSFNDAAQYLRLVNEMPGAASMNWKLEELFQRDIDWYRVERKIVPYLRQQEAPQFFNSLTIALLPIHEGEIRTFDGRESWDAPHLDGQDKFRAGLVKSFGPITAGYWAPWKSPADDNAGLGQVCWNTDQVCGVAIDGQHRLAAIKQLAGPGADTYKRSSVPVILLVLHPELGYRAASTRDAMIETLRRLFIDLNKHAQTVKRARQILLDDRDPASVCVRGLVGDQLRAGADELSGAEPRIPLTLVDWHSEQAKFDAGPYVTTILGLDWSVRKILGIQPFEDPMAFERIDKLIKRVEQRLDIELDGAKQRLDECQHYERPFAFRDEPVDELAMIEEGFRRRWSRALVHLFTGLAPYAELVELRKQLGTLVPEFANWYALKSSADDSGRGRPNQLLSEYERDLANRHYDPIAPGDLRDAEKACNELKGENRAFNVLAFNVVFQRALILAYLQFIKVSVSMTDGLGESEMVDLEDLVDPDEECEEEPESSAEAEDDESELAVGGSLEEERSQQLVAGLNRIIEREPEFLNILCEFPWHDVPDRFDRFWLASLAKPEGPIDFTLGASSRASDLLLLVGLFQLYREFEQLEREDFERLMERAAEARSGLDLKLQQCLGRMKRGDGKSIGDRILAARERENEGEEGRRREIDGRAAWLWKVLTE